MILNIILRKSKTYKIRKFLSKISHFIFQFNSLYKARMLMGNVNNKSCNLATIAIYMFANNNHFFRRFYCWVKWAKYNCEAFAYADMGLIWYLTVFGKIQTLLYALHCLFDWTNNTFVYIFCKLCLMWLITNSHISNECFLRKTNAQINVSFYV